MVPAHFRLPAVVLFVVIGGSLACQGRPVPTAPSPVASCQASQCRCSDGRVGAPLCDGTGVLTGCACGGSDAVAHALDGGDVGGPQDGGAAALSPDAATAGLDAGSVDLAAHRDAPFDLAPPLDTPAREPDAPADAAPVMPDAAVDAARPADLRPPADVRPDVVCPWSAREVCDGMDNDCDDLVDEGHVCPDWSVSNTLPFSDAVYVQGSTRPSISGNQALQRFWPQPSTAYYYGYDGVDFWAFRRTDWQLFYRGRSSIQIDDHVDEHDTVVPAPPCTDNVFPMTFGFDGQGTLHYVCHQSVRRGQGEVVTGASGLVAVLPGGRLVVYRGSSDGQLEAVDREGRTLSQLDLRQEWVGQMGPDLNSATTSGENVFVLLHRKWDPEPPELVLYRLDAESRWTLVRRVRKPDTDGGAFLAISDGTIFIRGINNHSVTALLPDGTSRIVWNPSPTATVKFTWDRHTLLVGPPQPSGRSVRGL